MPIVAFFLFIVQLSWIADHGGIDLLFSAMEKHIESAEVQTKCCNALDAMVHPQSTLLW